MQQWDDDDYPARDNNYPTRGDNIYFGVLVALIVIFTLIYTFA